MIRPLTCVCMLLAAGSGLYLYQVKHRAELLDRKVALTLKQTAVLREQIGVLKGEWALLNEPDRLANLSTHHLGLQTLKPTQFSSLADLGSRMPPPLAPGSTPVPPSDETPIEIPVASIPQSTPALVVASASPTVREPVPTAKPATHEAAARKPEAAPEAAKPERLAGRTRAPHRTTRLAEASLEPAGAPEAVSLLTAPVVSVAEPQPWTRTARQAPQPGRVQGLVATRPVPSGMSIGESVLRASRMASPRTTYAYARAETAPTYSSPAYVAPVASAPIASALGSSAYGALPPPVPYSGR